MRIPYTDVLAAPTIIPKSAAALSGAVAALHEFLVAPSSLLSSSSSSEARPSTAVLTGAGISVASGLADYRGTNGTYRVNKTYRPVYYPEFLHSHEARKRYWARSFIGWNTLHKAKPNATHFAIKQLNDLGLVRSVITQNVDSFHSQAHPGLPIVELHGYLRSCVCTSCREELPRDDFQNELARLNPAWAAFLQENLASGALDTENPDERRAKGMTTNPDGDVDLPGAPYTTFRYPACPRCLTNPPPTGDGTRATVEVDSDGALTPASTAGILKPAVVMFGESIRHSVRATAEKMIDGADRLLVLGTSLATYSAWRLAKQAKDQKKPIAIVNIGGVRGEDVFFVDLDPNQSGYQGARVEMSTDELLPILVDRLKRLSTAQPAHVASNYIVEAHGASSLFRAIIWIDMDPIKRNMTMKNVAGFHSFDLGFFFSGVPQSTYFCPLRPTCLQEPARTTLVHIHIHMASITAQADAIRSAVASVSTCTPAISASLKELLQGIQDNNDEYSNPSLKPPRKTTQTSVKTKSSTTTKTTTTTRKPAKTTGDARHGSSDMTPKEKALLATHVVNAALKALGEAAKAPQVLNPRRSPAKNDVAKPASRTRLRRSASVPTTPLQPRSLNRVETSPLMTKASLLPPTPTSTGCLALVECARVAFATLRSLQTSGAVTLPDLQLESGMSSLIAKLFALRLFDHAVKELRILKRRLESMATGNQNKKSDAPTKSTSTALRTLSDLLDYPAGPYPEPVIGFLVTAQLQALRILHELNRTTHLDAVLPFLRSTNSSSPLNLLLSCVQSKKADYVKIARQLESLSQILLSLTPSLASKDDNAALEPRLSPSPETSLEVQTLGLVTRLESWKVSGHKGDIDKEILLPFSRCLAAFLRRTSPEHSTKLVAAFKQVWEKIGELDLQVSQSSQGSLATVYQLLGKASQEAGNSKEAKKWTSKWKGLIKPDEGSAAKFCAVTAQLLALSLEDPSEADESLIVQVLDGMQGPLSGSVVELDDLLVSLCLLRKAAFKIVMKEPTCTTEQEPQKYRELLERFITQLPRFALRWLGKPPAVSGATKDLLRFEQRRQLLSKYLHQIVETALLLTKSQLDEDRFAWEASDPMLLDSLALLEYMGDLGQSSRSSPSASYHVKISHMYYLQHLALCKSAAKDAEVASLRALKRSIDSVREQPEPEQARAQLFRKWEAFVELCKASNRRDDAIDALRSIRDHLVRCDTVQAITTSLASQSVRHSWKISAETELLSRTVCNLAKLERRPNDWSWLLAGENKATALEHDLNFILTNGNQNQFRIDLTDPIILNLLQLYSAEQYPVRRLRSLLVVLATSLDSRDLVDKLQAEVEVAVAKLQDGYLGNDSGLARYIPHLRQSAVCILGIGCGEFKSSEIQQAISAWKIMAGTCQSASELTEHVDDPQQFLQTLRSLGDLTRMQGQQSLLTEIVELSTMISQLSIDDNIESHVVQSASLSLQYLTLGQSTKAEKALQVITDRVTLSEISDDIFSHFHLCTAEYYLAVGKLDETERHLEEARKAAVVSANQTRRRSTQLNRKISIAYASFLTSCLYLERGENHRALRLARTAVKILFHDWSELEQNRSPLADVSTGDLSQTDSSEEDSSLDNSRMSDFDIARANTGPSFWVLVYPLYRFTRQLSSTYEHLGMYQETLYYAEQAEKIARSMGSSGYLAQATTYVASVSLIAENIAKSLDLVTETKPALLSTEPTYQAVTALCKAASIYQQAGEPDNESLLLTSAETMLQYLQRKTVLGEDAVRDDLEDRPKQIPVSKTLPSRSRGRAATTAKPTPAPRKTVAKKTPAKAKNPPVKMATSVCVQDTQLKSLKASLLLSQSLALVRQQDWAAAITALRSAAQLSSLSSDLSQQHFLLGISLMGQSLSQMGSDSVFSFIQDSTLSFPSVTMTVRDKDPHGQLLTGQASPVRKPRSTAQDTREFVENLHSAQDHLLEAHSIATRNGNGFLVHRIAAALQNVVVLLANTNSSHIRASHSAYATCTIELARNLTWRRERKANHCDSAKDNKGVWPMVIDNDNARRSSLGFTGDMDRFQREYVDIIPNTWNVVSLSLNETKNELCITKLKAGSSPFALRLPLDRACSRDADNEVFDFPQGRSELLELIQQANRTCHDARDMSQKGAKSEWWAERQELDERLKQLLDNIELTWLGGFKGIFSQHHKRPDLLARFQKTFLLLLEKHLPSRRQVRGKKTKKPTAKVNLDPRILELFIGLGDTTVAESEAYEPLMDLLYFVVDVLQFHGETNAYDEIDFDAMVIDTLNALHAYHAATKETTKAQKRTHTILILDKSLHVFPWESLPCLQGLAVSRVPSLDYLRRAILEAKPPPSHENLTDPESDGPSSTASPTYSGHHVSINSGTYILNPSADLTNTQATFGKALSSLPAAWGSIETRAPTEGEFQAALTKKDVMLYFGHGSGAQYIRGRTIRQLEKCRAVALLMGCSSASLTHVGQFEPYGPIRDYMLAGCPAVVGTLWDVTDRDIDRFAAAVFEDWGLFPRGTFAKEDTTNFGKAAAKRKGTAQQRKKADSSATTTTASEGKSATTTTTTTTSLVQAVAKARNEACRFKYLTAAAVVVYGIPVYISK
ncbi:peptidase family C50-domain-containing protein [Xylaria acuta]|nr:peptidase family C50-domain-containing protein [Xylaria acuta]